MGSGGADGEPGMGRRGAIIGGVLVLALIVAAVLVWGGGSGDERGGRSLPPATEVAERLEKVRGVRFKRVPEVRVVSAEEAEEAGEEIAERAQDDAARQPRKLAAAQRQVLASQELLALTGTLEPDVDLQGAMSAIEGGLGGLYDSETEQVIVLEKAIDQLGDKAEAIVAHELTHALEDQAFGTFEPGIALLGDRAGARKSLLEGTATLAEIQYARRHLGVERPVLRILDRREEARSQAPIPKPLRRAISFPYIEGTRFAQALHDRGGWRLLDAAHRRPPISTEQIIHPDKWRAREEPVRLQGPAGRSLGRGWEEVGAAQLGELDVGVVLESGVSGREARRAAAGWGGGHFAVWHDERDSKAGCESPCRKDTAATLVLAWDTPADAREFADTAGRYLDRALAARPRRGGAFQLRQGAAALALSGTVTALSFAPSAGRAGALAREGLEPLVG